MSFFEQFGNILHRVANDTRFVMHTHRRFMAHVVLIVFSHMAGHILGSLAIAALH